MTASSMISWGLGLQGIRGFVWPLMELSESFLWAVGSFGAHCLAFAATMSGAPAAQLDFPDGSANQR